MLKEYRSRPRDEAAELIECHIAEAGLVPHQRLPSERAMCEKWGFNRATLRSALRKLITEGLLYSKVGSGTYVAPPKLQHDLQDMSSVQGSAAAAGRKLETRLLHAEVLPADSQVGRKLAVPVGSPVFAVQRLRLLDGVPVWIELAHLDYSRCPGIEKHDLTQFSLYRLLREEYGVTVAGGSEHIGITYTTAEEARLLQVPEGTEVFFMSGAAHDTEGRRVETFKSVIRADQIELVSTLSPRKGGAKR